MKIRLSQLFLCYPSQNFQFILIILFSLMFFKEVIVILSYMYCFWRNTATYLPFESARLLQVAS